MIGKALTVATVLTLAAPAIAVLTAMSVGAHVAQCITAPTSDTTGPATLVEATAPTSAPTGPAGERSSSTTVRSMPVLPAAALRTLPFGTGVLLLRQTKPTVIDLHPWTARRDAAALRADRTAVEHATATRTEVRP